VSLGTIATPFKPRSSSPSQSAVEMSTALTAFCDGETARHRQGRLLCRISYFLRRKNTKMILSRSCIAQVTSLPRFNASLATGRLEYQTKSCITSDRIFLIGYIIKIDVLVVAYSSYTLATKALPKTPPEEPFLYSGREKSIGGEVVRVSYRSFEILWRFVKQDI
jgi:hypothetical protein